MPRPVLDRLDQVKTCWPLDDVARCVQLEKRGQVDGKIEREKIGSAMTWERHCTLNEVVSRREGVEVGQRRGESREKLREGRREKPGARVNEVHGVNKRMESQSGE